MYGVPWEPPKKNSKKIFFLEKKSPHPKKNHLRRKKTQKKREENFNKKNFQWEKKIWGEKISWWKNFLRWRNFLLGKNSLGERNFLRKKISSLNIFVSFRRVPFEPPKKIFFSSRCGRVPDEPPAEKGHCQCFTASCNVCGKRLFNMSCYTSPKGLRCSVFPHGLAAECWRSPFAL